MIRLDKERVVIGSRRKIGNCGEDGDDIYNFESSRSCHPIGELTERDRKSARTELQPCSSGFVRIALQSAACFFHSVEL